MTFRITLLQAQAGGPLAVVAGRAREIVRYGYGPPVGRARGRDGVRTAPRPSPPPLRREA